MSNELNSVQESVKLALDAADAATDVTAEYSKVKRDHNKLERKVSQIHKYTNITFVTAMLTSIVCIVFSAILYFQTLGELKMMTTTNREGLVVFAENIEKLNTVLIDLRGSLEKQEELVKLNKESSVKVTEMMKLVSNTSKEIISKIDINSKNNEANNVKFSNNLSKKILDQTKGQNNGISVKLAGIESKFTKSINEIENKIVNNSVINTLTASQKNTAAQVEILAKQNQKILKLLEIKTDKISFP
tara:strand:- start:233 stop:970 length:738 start_codon:yes stop_codon:yes gene_type:complete